MQPPVSKAKIYEGIVCLEMRTPDGAAWWYQGRSLAYTPARIENIRKVVQGRTGARTVWAVPMEDGYQQVLVAINIPRSDVWTLKRRGLLPDDFELPTPTPTYTPWPDYARKDPQRLL